MADLILHKRSSTASAVPSAGSIALGELAINTADGRLFLKKVDGTVVDVTSIPGIAGLEAALAGKEPSLPAGGNSGHYLRGDKTWGVMGTAVRTAALTGLGTGSNTPIAATDTVLTAFAGLQAQVSAREPAITAGTGQQYIGGDKVLRDFGTVSRAVALTGLGTPTNTAIAATDTTLAAFAKLQGQVTARMANPMTTAGDMIRGGTSGAPERVAAGANGYVWTMVAGVPGWAAAPAAPARYESSPQVITAGGLLTLAHGLGAKPTRVQGFLSCVGAEQNYSVGDECPVSLDNQGTNSLSWGASCTFDATNIYVRPSGTAGSFVLLNKTTTFAFQITNANWRLIVRAEL